MDQEHEDDLKDELFGGDTQERVLLNIVSKARLALLPDGETPAVSGSIVEHAVHDGVLSFRLRTSAHPEERELHVTLTPGQLRVFLSNDLQTYLRTCLVPACEQQDCRAMVKAMGNLVSIFVEGVISIERAEAAQKHESRNA